LTGNQQQGHTTELGIGGTGKQVGCPWTECCQTNAGLVGQATKGGRHESAYLFVPGRDKTDRGVSKRLKKIKIFFTRYPEDVFNTFLFQCLDEEV